MSHTKEREQKICLNCGTSLVGRYCQQCGQENIEPRQTAWHLVTHFFSDITHFDGKFFTTVKDLFAKPGFLSREYINGRRMSYLDPIRMYIFTSAFFFIVFFSIVKPGDMIHVNHNATKKANNQQELQSRLAKAKTKEDTAAAAQAFVAGTLEDIALGRKATADDSDSTDDSDSSILVGKPAAQEGNNNLFGEFSRITEFDSAQRALPPAERMGWFKTRLKHRMIALNERYRNDKEGATKEFLEILFHNFPKLLFFSLPIFALQLAFIYVRRRKEFYYVDHGIFAVHLYIFSFLILLIDILFNRIRHAMGWGFLQWLEGGLFIFAFWYYYKAMRNFYKQRRFKTILKYMLLLFLSMITMLCLFTFYVLLTVFEI